MPAMPTRVTIHYNKFPEFKARAGPLADEIVQLVLLELVSVADPMTPVNTGNLKNNKTIGDDFVTWHAPYAGFVNYGTRHMAARPFIDEAVAQVAPMFLEAIAKEIRSWG